MLLSILFYFFCYFTFGRSASVTVRSQCASLLRKIFTAHCCSCSGDGTQMMPALRFSANLNVTLVGKVASLLGGSGGVESKVSGCKIVAFAVHGH